MTWVEYSVARLLIRAVVADHRWKKSIEEIHEPLKDRVREGHFGRAKKELGIEHRYNHATRGVGSRGPGSFVECRLPRVSIVGPPRPITSVEEWFRFAPPKKGAAQWKDGRQREGDGEGMVARTTTCDARRAAARPRAL